MSHSSFNNQPVPQIITSSFIVNDSHLNHEDVLSICKILDAITSLKDDAIVQVLGSLDFSRIILEHFYLDFLAHATRNDVVTFKSYTNRDTEDFFEVSISASKKKGKWDVPILNGSFVFAVKQGIEVAYSLS